MYRKTYVEINLDNISNNVKNIIKKYNNYKYYIAMVKANAYGHGYYVINEMINSGINYFAVSSLDEALQIRKYNKEIPVLCTEIIDMDCIDIAIKNDITITVCDINYLKELIKLNRKVKIHIKIDSGMHRLGVSCKEEFNSMYKLINENKNVYLEGLYTHYATPGISDNYYDIQVSNFRSITSDIDLNSIPIIHLSSSFILLAHPKLEFENAFRIGTLLYGYDISFKGYGSSIKGKLRAIRDNILIKRYNISKTIKNPNIDVKKCFKIKTNVIQIKDIKENEKVGYGLLFKAHTNCKVATIPIGYDDGIGNNHINRRVSINNKIYPVVGEVSMCMMNVLVDDKVKVGDSVNIISDDITLGEIARLNNTSFHNTLVNIGKNLNKVYMKNNKIVHEEKLSWEEVK